MYLNEVHNELASYYSGTYAVIDDKVVYIEDIRLPEPDGYTEDDEAIYSGDGDYDVMSSMDMFSAYVCIKHADGHENHINIGMDELDFSFPDMGLVNVPLLYNINNNQVEFNIAKHITRRSRRQWRRALRFDSIECRPASDVMRRVMETVTQEGHDELQNYLSPAALNALYFPKYTPIADALNILTWTVGSYALSSDWWVGQGKQGIVFGNGADTVGRVEDNSKFMLNDGCEFLVESLIDTIGEEYVIK